MNEKFRMIALGALIGTVGSVTLALPSIVPRSMADEQPLKTVYDVKDSLLGRPEPKMDFVKPDWDIEPSVSDEVLSSTVVRKIEFGRTSFVTIATTASGTYSSDGLTSPYVRYPGIHKVGGQAGFGTIKLLSNGGWELLREVEADSFVSVVPFEGGQMVVGSDGACAFTKTAVYC